MHRQRSLFPSAQAQEQTNTPAEFELEVVLECAELVSHQVTWAYLCGSYVLAVFKAAAEKYCDVQPINNPFQLVGVHLYEAHYSETALKNKTEMLRWRLFVWPLDSPSLAHQFRIKIDDVAARQLRYSDV